MKITVVPDRAALATAVADRIAALLTAAVRQRPDATVAFSGGTTPAQMLRALAERDVAWDLTVVLQVDERVVPDGDERRNAALLHRELLDGHDRRAMLMPVTRPDLETAAAEYADALRVATRGSGVIDVVHLGLGDDGHTASLIPGDPVLDVADADVAVTGAYQGTRRMTLTFPALDRARTIIWQVAGGAKADAVFGLLTGDRSPAARVRQDHAELFLDSAAAAKLPPESTSS